ncbi:Histidine kinase-, DNA gyrase B-, and HSP90-like ATPase [Streptomyces sp. 3213]|uniref:ATP-binding protein n=1 Tax=Streptomyces sp. 3213.3 TaxID=1855348 RepID=UPI00089669EF|nr:ATP-binding protein [Streptomyces sp. 3213.3]SED88879.1 Histidine kinase-, DNA gyrase B-, and HSP90-like ATPase [Streptomyces sp. 3213] [Streptomyces sp. 3213.3]
MASQETTSAIDVATLGIEVPNADVSVTIGPQFLQLFSEQLYKSPNKTFEELISNSWDAKATSIHVGFSPNLRSNDAIVWVLDNGESMDVDGFKLLWSVAHSTKAHRKSERPLIGKFGIGKLATYVLAHQLTYICKSGDGVIRAVTMDYRNIGGDPAALHIEPLPLPVRVLTESDLNAFLAGLGGEDKIGQALDALNDTEDWDEYQEFGGSVPPKPVPSGTWTLALLTDLKPLGREMQQGRIRRMLRTSLPLGGNVSIVFNDEPLKSSKLDTPVEESWVIGSQELGITHVTLKSDDKENEAIPVVAHSFPYPHVTIEGLGEVTGMVSLYRDSISKPKSDAKGASNGFFVNIMGRVVNFEDPYFGLSNLNHSAWAKFRAAVRVDGLNGSLAVNREAVLESRELEIAQAFLKELFNLARTTHDKAKKAAWPDAGEVLTETWGTVPLEPLQRTIEDGLNSQSLPSFVLGSEDEPTKEQVDSWDTVESPADVISGVTFELLDSETNLVVYDIATRRIIINESHPFAREYASTHELRLLLRDSSVVELLSRAYMIQMGVDEATLGQVDLHRDQLYRLVARLRRRSGAQIAELLEEAAIHSKDKALEQILGDALESLGFVVERLGGSNNPEGVARAPITKRGVGKKASYAVTYDAKSSINKKVKTGNVGVAGLVRHRNDHSAQFTLVVGPEFESGALTTECTQHKVTPMRARDLGTLVVLNATKGPMDLERLKDVFSLYDPDDVHEFVEGLTREAISLEHLSYTDLFTALHEIGFDEPDMLTTPVIAKAIRDQTGNKEFPTKKDVYAVLHGMSILAPNMVRVQGDNVFLGARPDKLRDAILAQLGKIPSQLASDLTGII